MHDAPISRDLRSEPGPRAVVPLWAILLAIVVLQGVVVGVFVRVFAWVF